MPRKLVLAFLIAAPIGAVLGFAAKITLSPSAAAGTLNLFLAFIILGALGCILATRPERRRLIAQQS